jgi:hypothetical protein
MPSTQGPPQHQQAYGGDPTAGYPYDNPRPLLVERYHERGHEGYQHKERSQNTQQPQGSSARLLHGHAIEQAMYKAETDRQGRDRRWGQAQIRRHEHAEDKQ